MKKISQDIKNGEFSQFYLLYGEEDYLKRQYRDSLANALVQLDDQMNRSYFEGKNIVAEQVLELGETIPFFGERRLIILENSGYFKKTPEDLEKKLEAFPPSTYVLFVEKEVDKRSRLYKWIGKNGYASEMKTPDEKMLIRWVKSLCEKEHKQMGDPAIYYMVEHMGTDMLLLKNEMDKLFAYCLERDEIQISDIQQICVSQAEDKIFEMLDAIGSRNQKKALLLYHDLLALKEPAMRVLYMLTRHYHILTQISGLLGEGKDSKTIASVCRIPPFSVKKYTAQANAYSFESLKRIVEKCQETDQGIKTGRLQDTVGMELLIVELSEGWKG